MAKGPTMLLFAAFCLSLQAPANPIEFGKRAVTESVGKQAANVSISVKKTGKPERYTIRARNGKVEIVGSDPVGAMYGAYEFAEQARLNPDKAWTTPVDGKPFLAERGLNLFLTLPWDYKKDDTDYSPAALTDPNRWWFHNDGYWTSLLDLMAKSRLNWLDIHGTWDISVTSAPNLYAYFVTSPSFPKVGVSEEIKAANLKQLNRIVEMAHARGIKVSLMAYEANLRIPQNPNPGYQATEPNVYKYTKEVVEKTIRGVPGLDAIGFRIGESGRGESFFNCYLEAVKASGRHIPLITRSWITTKQRVLPLARGSKDFTVEIKYNGEQWGSPYMVAGGRVANWYSYSFEDYLSDSGDAKKNAKTWPGHPVEGGGNWPSQPYKVVWQVRANGTHRIFPFYNPDWVRRSIREMPIGTASGYTIEGLDAYYPKKPDYYLKNPKDKYCDWIHQRDEMYWMTWGRLGYDPNTPDEVFDKRAETLLGSKPLVEDWKKASILLPIAFMAYSLGPDHRNHAPELEWGGDTNAYIQGQPFDSLSFIPINEELANEATGGIDGRVGLFEVGEFLKAFSPAAQGPFTSPRAKEISTAIQMMGNLSHYYGNRLVSAHSMALVTATTGREGRFDNWPTKTSLDVASDLYDMMAASGWYKPFTERLRMGTNTFHWVGEAAKVQAEAIRLRNLPMVAKVDFVRSGAGGGGLEEMSLKRLPAKDAVLLEVASEHATEAWLLYKPLPSSTYFHRMPMKRAGKGFQASLPLLNCGYAVAAELKSGETMWRCPYPKDDTPYLIIPAQPGPTPQYYNASEALRYLNPSVITPDKFSVMLIGTRSQNFFTSFDRSTKRKLLEPVAKGLKLVILQEDFAKFKLDWLPQPLSFENGNWDEFDPAGALGLEKVKAPTVMNQRFLKSAGWEVFGNGGIARFRHGDGEIWVTSARVMQHMHRPDAARAFVRLLSLGGKTKPTVLVDSCSEGGAMASSCHPDLMNSHEIPFLTLGEVVAQQQGMDSFTAIPGPVMADDVLNGRGAQIANAFLKGQVQKMAAHAAAKSQGKRELMRSLGLDPMPPKTPLNARITGVIQRKGYRIEKLVFESRPRFYVTAHLYIPDNAQGKLPVVVNVNGHWAHKKSEDRLQLPSAFQALQGYMAVTIDSPGWSFEGNALIERRAEGDHNDFFLVQGGTNTTGYYVWDVMRALDYLQTRPDADMSKIGITGASGGGLATLYAFAADDRFSAAVPVVYMSSMELAPDNGCLCNHVPGTCLVGDRSDVLGLQAPKPVLIMGAQNDGEFPPNAMNLTGEKVKKLWSAYGKGGDTFCQIFPGPHDYNKPMRERMIGFFNKYLRGKGNGSPVAEPPIEVLGDEDRQLLVLDPPLPNEKTMRDISKEYLANAPKQVSAKEAIALNGGLPRRTDLKYKEMGTGDVRGITFESEPGLVTPGVLSLPFGQKPRGMFITIEDSGKRVSGNSNAGFAQLSLDVLGVGELSQLEMRYPIYLGKSVPFIAGWQIVRAVEAMRRYTNRIEVIGTGPISSQAVMWAGLMDPSLKVTGMDCLKTWEDVFQPNVSINAIQPRAHLMGTLDNLRSQVKNGGWKMK